MERHKDAYNRTIECPKCGSQEITGEVLWYPSGRGFVTGDYICRVCNYRGKPEEFRAVPHGVDESFNPSRR